MQDEKECSCKLKYSSELSRLEVLTDLVEFAEKQKAKESIYTNGWADPTMLKKWKDSILRLRQVLPDCAVKDFDNERRRQKHRPDCQCSWCEEQRTNS